MPACVSTTDRRGSIGGPLLCSRIDRGKKKNISRANRVTQTATATTTLIHVRRGRSRRSDSGIRAMYSECDSANREWDVRLQKGGGHYTFSQNTRTLTCGARVHGRGAHCGHRTASCGGVISGGATGSNLVTSNLVARHSVYR